jgi:hypothetical protein
MANNQLVASDNFASGSLAAGWSAIPGLSVSQVTGTPFVTEPNTINVTSGQYWTGTSFPNDQICEVTMGAFTSDGSTALGLRIRQQSGVNSGYLAYISNGSATIYKVTAGATTSLITVGSLSFATGDVWTFAATGSVLFIYRNWKPVTWVADATYTSGTPGYTQISNVLAHCQVASFRGYNRVQQDGIWTKKQIVFPPLAEDITGSGTGIVGANIIQGTGTILSGTVYKLWCTGGNILTSACYIPYAESYDGISWTRGSDQLAGYQEPDVFFHGGTYYLYAQLGSATGTGNVFAFTSTDGVAWGSATDTGIGLGGVGTWDHAFFYNIIVVDVVAGTWYGLYGAGSNLTTFQFSMGLITSADGIHWTKYGSNPVQAAIQPSGAIVKVSGVYYLWATYTQPGQSTASADVNPAESVMWSSPDLINWTKVCFSYHHSEIDENVNGVIGQGNISAIIDIGGTAHIYTVASPNDFNNPLFFQLGLATASMPISSVVALSRQDGTTQIASDNFTSGPGDLSSNWTTPTGLTKLKIVAGPYCEPTVLDTHCVMYYSGATFSKNQYSDLTLRTLSKNGDYLLPVVRQQSGAFTCYRALIDGPTNTFQSASAQIYKTVAGANTAIGPAANVTPQVGDVWRVAVTDDPITTTPVISLYQNDALIVQVQDYGTPITGGAPGIDLYAASANSGVLADSQISLWAGGNANVTASAGQVGAFLVGP